MFVAKVSIFFNPLHDLALFLTSPASSPSSRNANEMAKRPESLKPQPEKHLTNLMQIMIETGHQATAPVAQCRHGHLVSRQRLLQRW